MSLRLFNDSKFAEVAFDFLIKVCSFGFQFLNLSHYCFDVDGLFFLESINVTGYVKIIVVVGNLL